MGAYSLEGYSLQLRVRKFGTTYLGAYSVGAHSLGAYSLGAYSLGLRIRDATVWGPTVEICDDILGASGGGLRLWGPTGLPATDETARSPLTSPYEKL